MGEEFHGFLGRCPGLEQLKSSESKLLLVKIWESG